MKQILKNRQGSVLQITLVIFLILISDVVYVGDIVINNAKSIKICKDINVSRTLEVMLIAYYKHQYVNDILFSDYYENENNIIEYTVDDMGEYYYIKSRITTNSSDYQFNIELDLATVTVKSIEYE